MQSKYNDKIEEFIRTSFIVSIKTKHEMDVLYIQTLASSLSQAL